MKLDHRTSRTRQIALALALGSWAYAAHAQYRVLPGRVDGDGFPTTAAGICLGDTGTTHCYSPPDPSGKSPFGLNPKATTVGHLDGQDLTLFTAAFSAGGSGELTNYALLSIRKGEFLNLLPKLQLTNQSEFAVWNLTELSPLPILVTADFVWSPYGAQGSNNEQETHFGRHHYAMRVYIYDQATTLYTERVRYTTEKTYPGLDDVDGIKVIGPEQKKILTQLRTMPSH
jgi:hypothetical protein